MNPEIVEIDSEKLREYDLYDINDSCVINNEKYTLIRRELIDGDDEWFKNIVIRESDNKLFYYDWGVLNGDYIYNNNIIEFL